MRYKYILIADYPAPWREKVYEIVYRSLGKAFHVVYCTRKEARRQWMFPLGGHPKTFPKAYTLKTNQRERFLSPSIVPFLLKHRPRVLIGFSLYPTVLLGFLAARIIGSKLVVFADTWLGRDRGISTIQKMLRRVVYRSCGDAFIGASQQTLHMFRHYRPGLPEDRLFLSSLCADNDFFMNNLDGSKAVREYDLVYSGRIAAEKNPLFFAEVACRLQAKLGHCRVLILGDGDRTLKQAMECKLAEGRVEFHAPGFVEHAKLPRLYVKGKFLLLPTSGDCWGVVLNEAMSCGMPVVTTEWTAAAGELVRHDVNGFVLPFDPQLWTDRITELLEDEALWRQFSWHASRSVQGFTFERAAQGIIDAIRHLDDR